MDDPADDAPQETGNLRGTVPPAWPWLLLLATVVATGSVLIRLQECDDSLWVDELHSAWAIAGTWSEVAPRAAAGNQTPWYFWLLRAWTQVLGSSEPLLRLPSALAVAASSGVLVIAAARASGRWTIGLLAGGLLAIDLNAIYFGSEARSYAFVILFTTIAAWAAVELSDQGNARAWRWRWTLWLTILFALLMHPTAGLALAVVLAAGWIWSHAASPAANWKWITPLGGAVAALVAFIVNGFVVTQVWQTRDHWIRFGVPSSAWDAWTMWPWTVIAIPLVVLIAAEWINRCSARRLQRPARRAVWPFLLSVVVAGTLVCWWLASYAGVPLWHRRYIVGLMPLLWWGTADAWSRAVDHLAGRLPQPSGEWVGLIIAMAVSLGGLLYDQQTINLWRDQRVVLRAEDWRGAVQWLNEHRTAGEPVYVGAELIESHQWNDQDPTAPQNESLRQYLLFPVSGPYPIDGAEPLGLAEDSMRRDLQEMLPDAPEEHRNQVRWLVYRIAEPQLNELYRRANHPTLASPAIEFTDGLTQAFGTLTVVRLETRWPNR